MDMHKLNPWNWFKHEDNAASNARQIPVSKDKDNIPVVTQSNQNSLLVLHREMDQLFDDVFGAFGMSPLRSRFPTNIKEEGAISSMFFPNIDVSGDDRCYEVRLDVPGLSKSDLSIDMIGDVLTISDTKEESSENKDKHFYRTERRYGSFQRTLSLPADADTSDMSASLTDGVLTLTIHRREMDKEDVRSISIS